ncbi:unnamed protein product [Malus baccata var. baccata]
MSSHTTTYMRSHKEKWVDDDVMRYPADGEAWKEFDPTFPEFTADSCNVRLGLATDRFNPFGVLNQHHSTWPIFVFSYNLPPWKCMKKEYMMMTLLITEDPGRSIDVYLLPLVDELKIYGHTMFTLRAVVMWTVNDFLAYAMVSRWSTRGYMACPICKEDITSSWHAGKVCYFGHRRWFPWTTSGERMIKSLAGRKSIASDPENGPVLRFWNRLTTHKSMFFELPYWFKLKLRHNLDVMHVEKNIFDTLVSTILDIEDKAKDTIKARLHLERIGIRWGLWMNRDNDNLAFFSMKPNDKKEFLKFLSFVKFPDGYASNIAHCVNIDRGKLAGLKSHDCHVILQRLLPVGIRHLLPPDVVKPIMLLSSFFSQLTSKTLRRTEVNQFRHDIVQVLCTFEMIFPPAFFTSTIHVMVHLRDEALLTGPVNFRWMYPIERYLLRDLKKSVQNKAKPEGSIIQTTFNRPPRNNDRGVRKEKLSVFAQVARPFEYPICGESFTEKDMDVAHWFVPNNCDETLSHLDEHENMMKEAHPSHLYAKKHPSNSPAYSEELYNLAFGQICVELHGSVKTDHGLLSVNTTKTWYNDDPYILATMAKQIVYLDDPKSGREQDHTDNDINNVADQRLESFMESGAETLRDTNLIQERFQIDGVSSIEIPIQSITIDLGNIPRYDGPVRTNDDGDVPIDDKE